MTCDIEPVQPDGLLYRIGRRPDPWGWPDWAYAGDDGTFGNRFDDPASEYRVLYASSERIGPFLETLARFRPDPAIGDEQIAGDPRDSDFATGPAGLLPASWLEHRALGTARSAHTFADVGHARSLAYLQGALAALLAREGFVDLDGTTLRTRAPRRFTQALSRHVYECTAGTGSREFDGIHYLSRLSDDVHNWAIYEPATVDVIGVEDLRRDDPYLLAAIDRFGLVLR